MKKSYILVVDSGLGGVNILKSLIKENPNENFLYVLDNKNCPYGNKDKEFLVQNIIKLINFYMHKYCIKLIVFACNTLTSIAIDEVRDYLKKQHLKSLIFKKNNKQNSKIDFNIFVVGTEPPIKMVNPNEKTLILATELTIKHNKVVNENLDNENFTFISLNGIAKLLDDSFFNRDVLTESLKQQIISKNYKNVVLGCTHYYYLEENIKQVLNNPNLVFFTATQGVCDRVKTLIKNSKTKNKNQKVKIFLTKRNYKLKHTAKYILKN